MKKLLLILFLLIILQDAFAAELPRYHLSCDLDMDKLELYNHFNSNTINISKEDYFEFILINEQICLSNDYKNCSIYMRMKPRNYSRYMYNEMPPSLCMNHSSNEELCLNAIPHISINDASLFAELTQREHDKITYLVKDICKNISLKCVDGDCPRTIPTDKKMPFSNYLIIGVIIIGGITLFFLTKKKK